MGPNILNVFTDNTFLFYFGLWTYSIHLKGVHGKRSQSYFVFITVLQSLKVRAVKTCFQVGTETQSYKFAVTNKRKSCPPWKWQLQGRGEQSQTNGEERTHTETGKRKQKGRGRNRFHTWGDTYFEGGKDQKNKDFTIYHTSQKTNNHGKGTKTDTSTYKSLES